MDWMSLGIAMLMGSISIGIAIWSRTNKVSDDILAKINSKVDQEDYEAFAKRIGRQVDHQDDEIVKVGKAIAFIVGKMGGDYSEVVKD